MQTGEVAWIVRLVPQRMLGASVGGLLVLTNMRTLLNTFGVSADLRAIAYAIVVVVWVAAVAVSYAKHRSDQQVVAERA